MPLVNDAGLDPTNVTYDLAFDGRKLHAGLTPAIGNKYITLDSSFPNGSGGFLPQGSLALCTATSPETWVALHAPSGMRLADTSTGIIWLRTEVANTWNAVEAWLDIVADPSQTDVSTALNALIAAVGAISASIPIYLGPTTFPLGFPQGWHISRQINNPLLNPMICLGPIVWSTATVTGGDTCAVRVGSNGVYRGYDSQIRSVYWVQFSTNNTPNYTVDLTGVEFMNCLGAIATVRTYNFRMGVNVIGDGTNGAYGSAGNRLDLDTLGCLKAVGWTCQNGQSFVNENILYYGNYGGNDTAYTADSVAMLRIGFDSFGGEVNGNKWYGGPDFEAGVPSGGAGYNYIEVSATSTTVASGIIANEFHGIRIDTPQNPKHIHFSAASVLSSGLSNVMMYGNLFNYAYVGETFTPTFDGVAGSEQAVTACAFNTFEFPYFEPHAGRYEGHPLATFGRPNVTQRLSGGSLLVQAPARGKFYLRQAPAGFYNETRANYGQLTANSIQLASSGLASMGVFIDVRNTPYGFLNKVLFKANIENASGGRIVLIAYGHDGQTAITSSNDIQSYNGGSLAPLALGGSVWAMGGDMTPTTSGVEVAWSNNVGFLFLAVTGGTNPAYLVDAEVFAPGDSGAVLLTNSLAMPVLGPSLPLIDDDLPYSVGTPSDPAIVAISIITPGTTTQITTSTAHGYAVGLPVYLTGITGTAPVTSLNGTTVAVATVVSSTVFTIAVNTTGGTYTSGGTTQVDFVPRGQTVRATLPSGTAGTAAAWVRTASDTWVARNF